MEVSGSTQASASVLDGYRQLVGGRAMDRLQGKARRLRGLKLLHINSTRHGGGVAEILSSLTPMMNEAGIAADWLVIDGNSDFFSFTKDIHNGLHGEPVPLNARARKLHRESANDSVKEESLGRYDVIAVHDPQPLPLIERRSHQIWIWCCHIDLSAPDPNVWNYLGPMVNRFDAVIFSLPEYAQPLSTMQRFIMPAISPFSQINRDMTRAESIEHLRRYGIPLDRPLVVQAGRFDKWKDPYGVIEACRIASQQAPSTLVLAGNPAADDPEGPMMYERLRACSDDRIIIIAADDPLLVNALQRRASVVLQKSIREGFGLTVSEAMWKRRAVIGGKAGGICHQIVHDHSGFLVINREEAAACIAALLQQPRLRVKLGRRAKARVRGRFLMTRLLEDWIDLVGELALRASRKERMHKTSRNVQSAKRTTFDGRICGSPK
jgi:trehalose synthase